MMNENKANYAKIGAFVLCGFALIFVMIAVAGAKILNREVVLAETYFTESVTGLAVGSAVKYRGVPVGEVGQIGFIYATYAKRDPKLYANPDARKIFVSLKLDPERFPVLRLRDPSDVLSKMVDAGLRVKLSSSGVTGLAFLELDYFAKDQDGLVIPKLAWKPDSIYIPSTGSTMVVLKQAMDDVVMKLGGLDIAALGDELLETLRLFQDKMLDVDLKQINTEAVGFLKEVRETNHLLQNLLETPEAKKIPKDLQEAIVQFKTLADSLNQETPKLTAHVDRLVNDVSGTFHSVNGMVSTNQANVSQAVKQLNEVLQSIHSTLQAQQGPLNGLLNNAKSASYHLDLLLKELSENPAVLLFGKPPKTLPEMEETQK